jgi:hypothetical protein
MVKKGDLHRKYAVHGDGVESLRIGFGELGMLPSRQEAALAIARDVAQANGAAAFRWYKPPATDELCCYWDDAAVNQMWISTSEVHVAAWTSRPDRPLTWQTEDRAYVGWLLPGAEARSGGGSVKALVAEVVCPSSFVLHPQGTECPMCDIVHD